MLYVLIPKCVCVAFADTGTTSSAHSQSLLKPAKAVIGLYWSQGHLSLSPSGTCPFSSSLWSSCLESHSCSLYSLRTWWGHAANEIAWLLRKCQSHEKWNEVSLLFKAREKTPVFESHDLYSFNVAARGQLDRGRQESQKKDSISHFLHSHVWLYCHSQAHLWQGHTFFFVLLRTVLQIMTFNVNMNTSIPDNILFLVPPHCCSV